MKLYYFSGACSLASNIALREAGLPFELVKVDRRTRKAADGLDFTEVNPKGYVPALTLDSGEVLTENIAVLQYIADRNPASRLEPPAGTMERHRRRRSPDVNPLAPRPRRGGRFTPVVEAADDYYESRPFGTDGKSSIVPSIVFQPVPEPKVAKSRVHFDVQADGGRGTPWEVRWPRVTQAVGRFTAARATVIRQDAQDGIPDHVVMADPEGNEFCVL